jgi:hypothetical protein
MDLGGKFMISMAVLFSLMMNSVFVQADGLNASTDILLQELNTKPMDAIIFWNLVMLQASANDHDASIARIPDQPGPGFASRTFAIVHGAMYEAMNVFYKVSKPLYRLQGLPATKRLPKHSVSTVAIMEAAYGTLHELFPKQNMMFEAIRTAYLGKVNRTMMTEHSIQVGIKVGMIVASTILTARQEDGGYRPAIYTPIMQPGFHRVDPTHPNQSYLGFNWPFLKPFYIKCGTQFLAANIVGTTVSSRSQFLNSTLYEENVREVQSIGSRTSSTRTADQTEVASFWGYDGGPKVGHAPRIYNQVVRAVAMKMNNTLVRNALLFALINYGMVDAGIVILTTKYYYNFWRPIVAIRAGAGSIPADPNWLPLGAPADGNGDNFTPASPSFISGHAMLSSTAFEILRRFYGNDKISFEFQSDEYNGKTVDSITNTVRPAKSRRFESFTQAEMESSSARIYAGIHWPIDRENSQIQGRKVGDYIFGKLR